MPPQNRYVALYCRISKDDTGRKEGVQLQERWGREYAAQTWPDLPVVVFRDNNLSGDNEQRSGYVALCQAIDQGEVAHLWTVEQTRFSREDPIPWFTLCKLLDAAGITEIHTKRNNVVEVGGVVGDILAILSSNEKKTFLKRLRDNLAEKAVMGQPGGVRPFGYEHHRNDDGARTYVHRPEEAKAIRFAAEKILAGWSLSNVAKELTARGHVGAHHRHTYEHTDDCDLPCYKVECRKESKSTPVTAKTVRSMVTSHATAGLRVHKEQTYKGNWEPILDMATWQAVRAKLGAARVVTRVDGGTYPVSVPDRPRSRRRYLLTGGLAVCGVCGARLMASMKQLHGRKDDRKPYYLCHPKAGGRGCVGILGDELEQYVGNWFIDVLNDPDFLDGLKGDDESAARRDALVTELEGIDAEIQEAIDMRAEKLLTPDRFKRMMEKLTQREQRLRAELVALPSPESIIDPARIAADWDVMTRDERRAALGIAVARVTVRRARPGAVAFDPGRVDVELLDSVRRRPL